MKKLTWLGMLGVLAAAIVVVSRRLDRTAMGTSWKGRNARLARMGVKVGRTFASTAARKTFAWIGCSLSFR